MKKLQILALHLSYGGIEKAIIDLANNLSPYYNVEIVSTYKILDKPAYNINKNIVVRYLMNDLKPNRAEFKNSVKNFRILNVFREGFKSLKIIYLRKKMMKTAIQDSDADILISTRVFHNKLLSRYADTSKTLIAWEHNHHHNNRRYFNSVIKSSRKLDYLVLISKELYNDYNSAMLNYKCKCVCISNMVDIEKPVISKLNDNSLISVARLSKEKGLFDLIDVFKLVYKYNNKVKLNIIGNGILYNDLNKYIIDNNLEDSVKLHGYRDSGYIYEKLSESDLFVMTSYTECFPICLLEAFAHGVPSIAFSSAEGARELIVDGYNGYLIQNRDKDVMAKKIVELLANKAELKTLQANAIEKFNDYKADILIDKWRNILN